MVQDFGARIEKPTEMCSSLASPAWHRSLSVMSSPCSVTFEHGCDHGAASAHQDPPDTGRIVRAGSDSRRGWYLPRWGVIAKARSWSWPSQGHAVLQGRRRGLRGPGRDFGLRLVDLLRLGFLSIQGFALVNLHFGAL